MGRTTSDTTKSARFNLVARLADNKYLLGRRYAEWCSSAPVLESSVAAAAMAQDELGHARALYPLLKTLEPSAGPEVEPETRTRFMNHSALDVMFAGWLEFVAANFLIDTAMTEIFHAALESSFAPLAGRSRKTLQEERMHWQHAEGWIRRLARHERPVRDALERSLLSIWDETLMWFGPEGKNDQFVSDGTLDASPDELRRRFLSRIGPVVVGEGLNLPIGEAGDVWELTAPLPWRMWDAETRRIMRQHAEAATSPLAAASEGNVDE